MRQEVDELWHCSIDADNFYRLNRSSSLTNDLDIRKMSSPQLLLSPSPASSICSESTPASPSRENSNQINESDNNNFIKYQLGVSSPRRKISDSSDASSYDSISPAFSPCLLSPTELTPMPGRRFDDIIEKIVELKFSGNNTKDKNEDIDIIDRIYDRKIKNKNNDDDNNNDDYDEDNDSDDDNEVHRDLNANYNDEEEEENDDEEDEADEADDSDEDLQARGPIRPKMNSHRMQNSHHHTFDDWLENAGMSSYTSNIDSTAQQIFSNQYFRNVINPCLDRLENSQREKNGTKICGNQWTMINNTGNSMDNTRNFNEGINKAIPAITFTENSLTSEELIEMINSKQLQAAVPDNINLTPLSGISETWPDSPASISSFNVLSSRPHSRASSRAQSPRSAHTGSPAVSLNIVGSPSELPPKINNFRVPTALSSSSSSNHSFSDTPSPSNYQYSIEARVEEQLGSQFVDFSCCNGCESSATVTNTSDNSLDFDNNLRMVEEIIGNNLDWDESQVVPNQFIADSNTNSCKSTDSSFDGCFSKINHNHNRTNHNNNSSNSNSSTTNYNNSNSKNTSNKNVTKSNSENHEIIQQNSPSNIINLGNTASLIASAHNDLVYPDPSDNCRISDNYQNYTNPEFFTQNQNNEINFQHELDNLLSSNIGNYNTPGNSTQNLSNPFYYNESQHESSTPSSTINNYLTNYNGDFSQISDNTDMVIMSGGRSCSSNSNNRHGPLLTSTHNQNQYFNNSNNWSTSQSVPFNNFQIPETVSSFKLNHSKRNSDRQIAPWPSLNLPLTEASKRLKDGLAPKNVEKAMKDLLKKSTRELSIADEDGDTMLMCLVGNATELEKKKAYLVPLVERLGTEGDALSKINNRGEDALYLAAMNCPQMPEVTGYLGAVMIKKRIDISQRLYQTKGDTLIHAVVSNGDTHLSTLAELLALKTCQGNGVFDLSKCNYDGRTPLHVAVEAHDPSGSGVNSIATIRLLLENGADPKIKEIKCGNTPLHLAVSLSCDPALIKALLIRNGHEAVNIQNRNKNTALHMVAAVSDRITLEKQMEVCASIINAGGLTNILNQQGKAPLALVSIERKEYIRNIFRKKF